MNEKLTKQLNILISEREYSLLYKEAYRLSMVNGSRCSISSLVRKYITPHIEALDNSNNSHDTKPDTDPDTPHDSSPSIPPSNPPSIPASDPTSARDTSNNFNFDDLSI